MLSPRCSVWVCWSWLGLRMLFWGCCVAVAVWGLRRLLGCCGLLLGRFSLLPRGLLGAVLPGWRAVGVLSASLLGLVAAVPARRALM